MRPRLPAVAIGVALVGVIARVGYALVVHHPRHHATSDASEYLALAQRFLDTPQTQHLSDTIWPPGASAVWALLLSIDGGLSLVALANVLASVMVVGLIASSAQLLSGARAGWWALIFASLHFGLIHYAGFALAEQLFQLTVTFAVWASVVSLRWLPLRSDRSRYWRLLSGLATGLAWALAALFRPNALPVVLFASSLLGLHWLLARERAATPLAAGVVLGLLLVLVPASDRCTTNAGGHFCLVSNNIAMNMALGQAGAVYGLEFRDPKSPENATSWVPPALLHHGYKGLGKLPATIYDTPGVLRWYFGRLVEDPTAFVGRAIGNGFDLFGLDTWPDNYGSLGGRTALVIKQLFFALVLIPGLLGMYRLARSTFSAERRRSEAVFIVGAALGVFISAALSLGEARYRLPFDALLLIAASMVYAKVELREPSDGNWRGTVTMSVVAMTLAGAGAGLVLAVSHPSVALGMHLKQRADNYGVDLPREWRTAASLAKHKSDGAAWDSSGSHVFDCSPNCRELTVRFAGVQRAARLSVGVDHNDRYRVYFYRQHRLVGHQDAAPPGGRTGLRTVVLVVPPRAAEGFDAVGVVPLYGDRRYALGHVIPLGPALPARHTSEKAEKRRRRR